MKKLLILVIILISSLIIFFLQFGNEYFMDAPNMDKMTKHFFSYDYKWFFIQFFLIIIIGISLTKILQIIFNNYQIKNISK